MGKKIKLRLFLILGLLALVVVGATAYYFGVYVKTPEYAVKMIIQSIDRHDKQKFYEYVDIDAIADVGYDEFTAGLADTPQGAVGDEAVMAVRDFGRIIKKPIVASFKSAIDGYLETGNWEEKKTDDNAVDSAEIISRIGLDGLVLKGIDSIDTDREKNIATVKIRLFQKDAKEDFVAVLRLDKKDGRWKAAEVTNLREYTAFVNKARRQGIVDYLDKVATIASAHDKITRDADFEFQKILAAGTLGRESTRSELRDLMEKTVKRDWQARKSELAALAVPESAASLHHLLNRICDLHIAYADTYSKWLRDKNASTIREAESQLKQAKTLESEAEFMIKRMGAGESLK